MTDNPRVILSGFADETTASKSLVEQFTSFSSLGLNDFSIRFVDAGSGIKNVMQLSLPEIQKVRHHAAEYGLNISSIGSPIGKVKLLDQEDGTKNQYIPFSKYLEREVKKVCELAHAFETKLIRGFSFYPPAQDDPAAHLPQAVDQLAKIAEACHREDLTFGVEIEANLVGRTGQLMAEIYRQVNHPAMMLIFDAANILVQGFHREEVFEQYLAMRDGLGWMHIKDYRHPRPVEKQGHVNEEALSHFVPADEGDAGHEVILRDFANYIPALEKKLRRRGIPGVFIELEPHVKGGGQFGGYSGPDGMGVALRALCRVLDYVNIDFRLRDFSDIQAARGF